MKTLTALLLFVMATATHAQGSPVGLWKTVDDGGQEKSLVRISESAGALNGRIEKLLHPSHPNPTCDKCTDERKGKPITGMTIFDGLKQNGDVWQDGKILDPESGKLYTVRLKLLDAKTLQMRGYLGPFYRTQTWTRVE